MKCEKSKVSSLPPRLCVKPERSAAPSGGRQWRGVPEAVPRPQTPRRPPTDGPDAVSGATAALRLHAAPPPERLGRALPIAAVFSRLRLRPNFQATVSRRPRAGRSPPRLPWAREAPPRARTGAAAEPRSGHSSRPPRRGKGMARMTSEASGLPGGRRSLSGVQFSRLQNPRQKRA